MKCFQGGTLVRTDQAFGRLALIGNFRRRASGQAGHLSDVVHHLDALLRIHLVQGNQEYRRQSFHDVGAQRMALLQGFQIECSGVIP